MASSTLIAPLRDFAALLESLNLQPADEFELFSDPFGFALKFETALNQPDFGGVVLMNANGKPTGVLTAEMLRALLSGEAELDPAYTPADAPKDISAGYDINVGGDFVGRDGAEPPSAEPALKAINAWIEGHDPTQAMRVGQRYPLRVNIGDPRADTLVDSAVAQIAETDIPTNGLDTRWMITSESVDIEPESDAVSVATKSVNGVKTWLAMFDLHIPKLGDSATVQLSIAPLRTPGAALAVTIYAGESLFRKFALTFDAAIAVHDHVQVRRGNQTTLHPPHEWQTPCARLTLVAHSDRAVQVLGGLCNATTGQYITLSPTLETWNATQAALAGPVTRLRAVTEKWRGASESYFNDIALNDLMSRLGQFASHRNFDASYAWQRAPNLADAAHTQKWEQVRQSAELKAVAERGRILYDTLFPLGKPLRDWLDQLAVGCRVDVSTSLQTSWVPDIPWPLLYLGDPQQPIDPFSFWGMRFRTQYLAYATGPADVSLGQPQKTYRGHALYWGSGPTDATTLEADVQRQLWAGLSQYVFAPGNPPSTDPAAELRALFGASRPGPMPVVYFFCQTALDPALNNSPVLRFGPTNKAGDVLDVETAISQPLPDRPLVFANACSTADADPYVANALEATFFRQQCRAFLGTSTKVPIQFASRFATLYFHFFYRLADPKPMAAGEAVTQTRLFLWTEYRNLGGLLYNYINHYDLFMAEPGEISGVQV
ncbi:MAG: CHAT domain-containing protein [Anaerolineales bacterium]